MKTLLLLACLIYFSACTVTKPKPVEKSFQEKFEEFIIEADRLQNGDLD